MYGEKPITNNEKLNYHIDDWEGRNYFLGRFKLITGAEGIKPLLLTFLIVSTPTYFFLAYNFSWYSQNIHVCVPVFLIILYLLVLNFLFKSGFSDPGILPRRIFIDGIYPLTYDVKSVHLGYFRKFKICSTCYIVRPPRTSHCTYCDNCVERLDHHCPWIGNCVGKRNYSSFYILIFLISFTSIYILTFSIIRINIESKSQIYKILHDDSSDNDQFSLSISLTGLVVNLYISIYIFFSMLFSISLFIYHTRIISKNLTTREEIKSSSNSYNYDTYAFTSFTYPNSFKTDNKKFAKIPNPFHRGVFKNFIEILFPRLNIYSTLVFIKNTTLDYLQKQKGQKQDPSNEISDGKINKIEIKYPHNISNETKILNQNDTYNYADDRLNFDTKNLHSEKIIKLKKYTGNKQEIGEITGRSNKSFINHNYKKNISIDMRSNPYDTEDQNAFPNLFTSNRDKISQNFNSNHFNDFETIESINFKKKYPQKNIETESPSGKYTSINMNSKFISKSNNYNNFDTSPSRSPKLSNNMIKTGNTFSENCKILKLKISKNQKKSKKMNSRNTSKSVHITNSFLAAFKLDNSELRRSSGQFYKNTEPANVNGNNIL